MSDDFLERLREPPRPEFARELYGRLARQPEPRRRPAGRLSLALAALALLLALGGLLSATTDPGARGARRGFALAPPSLAASAHQSDLVVVWETQTNEQLHLLGSCAGCPRDLAVRRVVQSHHR